MKIDLHIHTKYSDGVLSPKQIIDIAAKNDIKVISFADHDTIEAYSEDVFEYAKKNNVQIIPAVEISTRDKNVGIHILGYNFSINNDELKKELSLIRNSRHDYLNKVGKVLNELGFTINLSKLNRIEAVTKAHIANDIIENPKNKNILLAYFKHIPNMGEFIEEIMNEGCSAYVEKKSITPKQASEIIRKAGGKVVLAHPIAYEHEDKLNEIDILKIINEINADGIESYYIYIDKNNIKFDEIKRWNLFAERNGLNVTIGSDFHREDKIRPAIGFLNQNFELNDKEALNIVNWILRPQ